MRLIRRLLWRPSPAPERMQGVEFCEVIWRELDERFRPRAAQLPLLELATLLLVDSRESAFDWPSERFAALTALFVELRK